MRAPQTNISNLKTLDEVIRFASISLGSIINVINGNLTLRDNVFGEFLSFTFTAANQEVSVEHSLKTAPNGYLVVSMDSPMIIYDGLTPNTDTVLYLRSSAAGTAQVFIF